MNKKYIVADWEQMFEMFGHSSTHPELEEIMFETLGFREQPRGADVIIKNKHGISLWFDFDSLAFNKTHFINKKSNGNFILEALFINDTYKGYLPFNLSFRMTYQDVENLLKESFVEDGYLNGTFVASIFYFQTSNLLVSVFFDTKEKEHSKKKITSLKIATPTIYNEKNLGIKPFFTIGMN